MVCNGRISTGNARNTARGSRKGQKTSDSARRSISKIVEDTNERIAEALEMLANQSVELDDRGQSVLDSDDSQDDAEDQDSIQAAQQEQADAED